MKLNMKSQVFQGDDGKLYDADGVEIVPQRQSQSQGHGLVHIKPKLAPGANVIENLSEGGNSFFHNKNGQGQDSQQIIPEKRQNVSEDEQESESDDQPGEAEDMTMKKRVSKLNDKDKGKN